MLRTLCWVLVACGMGLGSAQAAVLQVNASGELTGATGVIVGAQTYNVQFLDGTCVALFSGCDDDQDFTFHSEQSALLASEALLNQVFLDVPSGPQFDTQPALTLGCDLTACFATTPYELSSIGGFDFVNVAAAVNSPIEVLDTTSSFLFEVGFDTSAGRDSVYAVWSLSNGGPGPSPAPTPGTLSLFMLALLTLGWSRFKTV